MNPFRLVFWRPWRPFYLGGEEQLWWWPWPAPTKAQHARNPFVRGQA